MNSSNFPNLEVTWVDPKTLTFPNRRVRRHSKKQLHKLRASIAAFGWTHAILKDEKGMVLCGAGRLTVALEDGIELVPVTCIGHLNEAEKRAFIIACNRIAEDAEWDRGHCQSKCTRC